MKNVLAVCLLVLASMAITSAAVHAEDKVLKLVIVKAEYGDLPTGTKSDVTEKVKGMVNADGLSVAATNDNFGDPVENTVKKLKIEYTLDDKKLDQTVAENETLTIAVRTSKIKIVKASYGDLPDGAKADVTEKVQKMVKGDTLSVEATNDNFGDPANGTPKKLKVEFTFAGGIQIAKEVGEGETLTISDKGE